MLNRHDTKGVLIFRRVHHLKGIRFPGGVFSDSATSDLLTSARVDYRHGHHVPSTAGILGGHSKPANDGHFKTGQR
jgi:hypothetical protein